MLREEPVGLQSGVTAAPFPAVTKQAAGLIDRTPTDVMSIAFADKITVTITQGGRLAQWIQVPLDTTDPTFSDQHLPISAEDYSDSMSLLPLSHLTPSTILGGTVPERETQGQLIATHIASAVATRDPNDSRTVLVGLGLQQPTLSSQEAFFDLVELVSQCL